MSSSAGSRRALRRSLLIAYPMLKQGCSYREIEKVEKHLAADEDGDETLEKDANKGGAPARSFRGYS